MTGVTRYSRDPWSIFDDLVSIQGDFNRLFGPLDRSAAGHRTRWPLLNVWSSGEGLVVDAELPGVDPNDVDVSVKGDELTLKGKLNVSQLSDGVVVHRQERSAGEFTRRLQLPFKADGAGVKASYKRGVLRINIPRAEEEKTKRIAIEVA